MMVFAPALFVLSALFLQEVQPVNSNVTKAYVANAMDRFNAKKDEIIEQQNEIRETLKLMRTKAVFLGDKYHNIYTFSTQLWRVNAGKVETIDKKTLAAAIAVEKQKLAKLEELLDLHWSVPYPAIYARSIKTGDVGILLADDGGLAAVKALQILEPGSFLASCDGEILIIRDVDTDDLVDGRVVEIRGPLYVMGTESYAAVSGTKKTVFALRALKKAEIAACMDLVKASLPEKPSKFREWAAAKGDSKTNAEFVAMDKLNVVLRKEDGKEIVVPKIKLSQDDRTWLKENADETELKK